MAATELGEEESSGPNIASRVKGCGGMNQVRPATTQAAPSMVKTKQSEDCSPVTSHHGSCLACYRTCQLYTPSRRRGIYGTSLGQASLGSLNVRLNLPKEGIELIKGTTGSPKGSNSYGDRAPIVPVSVFPQKTADAGLMFRDRGRGAGLSPYSTHMVRGGASARSLHQKTPSMIMKRLQDLEHYSKQSPNVVIDWDLYGLLLEPQFFYMAYDRLKSKPGNLTPGVTPTTLDGLSEG